MARTIYQKTALTGGASMALDSIPGSTLADGDFAFIMTSANAFYVYVLDADSGAAESSPTVILPDSRVGNEAWILQTFQSAVGNLVPTADNTYNLGSVSYRWANVYTGDLHLSNNKGDWTIQEGESDLYLINNKTGKRYSFVLKAVDD